MNAGIFILIQGMAWGIVLITCLIFFGKPRDNKNKVKERLYLLETCFAVLGVSVYLAVICCLFREKADLPYLFSSLSLLNYCLCTAAVIFLVLMLLSHLIFLRFPITISWSLILFGKGTVLLMALGAYTMLNKGLEDSVGMLLFFFGIVLFTALYFMSFEKNRSVAAARSEDHGKPMDFYESTASGHAVRELLDIRHDLKQQIHIIEKLVQEGRESKGEAYLTELNKRIDRIIVTGSEIIDTELKLMFLEMEKNNIIFQYQICDLQTLPLNEMDFSRIIHNLLANAMESVNNPKNPKSDRSIRLAVFHVKDMMIIECLNPCDPLMKDRAELLKSSKTEKGHGRGTAIIQKITKSINGNAVYSVTEHVFTARVYLPF